MLIVLRGNSGSGKSTVARMLQQELGWPTAVLEQDYFCRVVFDEPDQRRRAHADLLEVSAAHCLQQGHHVVLDGIFNAHLYADTLERIATHTDDARFFGFHLDFEETARRHPDSGQGRHVRRRGDAVVVPRVATVAVRERTADRARPLPQRDRPLHPRLDSLTTQQQQS